MKKVILSTVLAAVMFVSGCSSGVSQESYNSVVEENSKLQSEKSSAERENSLLKSEKSSLENENISLKSENIELKEENRKLQEDFKDNTQTTIADEHNDNFKYDVFTTADDEKQFIVDKTGNKWHCRLGAFVSYIEENNYSKLTDDEMVVYTYYDMIYGVSNYPTVAPLYCFVISNKNGDYIAYGFLTISNEGGEGKVTTTMTWYGDYERLNSNYNHIKLFEQSSQQ